MQEITDSLRRLTINTALIVTMAITFLIIIFLRCLMLNVYFLFQVKELMSIFKIFHIKHTKITLGTLRTKTFRANKTKRLRVIKHFI